ncbi:unnamed protein product [Rotaria magnacalcarata]|uniref:Innexin n=4 Tax=Rotaria magnacalcarata TaxID=392030 RepID=A0A816B2L9_9BILA|nr:unnamed protein product [Rotaria magnacalcarata]CAF1639911.1 unnamed protein product [Rotaria magnacalcarata]CAF1978446.1 unnamed protein product [Rotaria magnacalcarata]CAF2127684.1 unnamed protein product [Rotaria magnacalcarata]
MDKIIISEDRYGRKLNRFEDDDLIDRLNSRYTVMALVMCIFIITGKAYVGDPINCWTPAQFSGTHNAYTNSICWLKGSYYLPTEEITIPDRSKPRLYHVSYYQWTPFILLGMGLFFLLPRVLWQAFARQGGVNIQRLVKTIKDQVETNKGVEQAQKTIKLYLDTQRATRGSTCCGIRCQNFYTTYTLTYFIIKLLYILNALCQFFLLNTFLSFHFTSYGPEALNKLFSGEDFFESPRFPRVTMCDFMIRHLGSNQHWYAIQCNLPINIYNDKIFLGIWVWLIVLVILNLLSIIPWILFLKQGQRSAAIRNYLRMSKQPTADEKESLLSSTKVSFLHQGDKTEEFINYLRIDGFLILHIIARNTDDIVAGQIVDHLYKNFEPERRSARSDV